jgi:methylthioribose-1-phosphate isomerase
MTERGERVGRAVGEAPTHEPFTGDGIPRALWWDDASRALCLIDQTLLPHRLDVLECISVSQVAEAIRSLRVRGAPALGIAAAYALAIGAREVVSGEERLETDALDRLRAVAEQVRTTRPTAVNLGWALDRGLAAAQQYLRTGGTVIGLPERLLEVAHAIAAEDAAACAAMGEHGANLIGDGDALLTHCNAGALATGGIGTALAPIFTAHRAGKRLHVYVDETRPVLQGARLTAWELARAGVPMTLITDSMAAHVLRTAGIKAVIVGADRIAANGDTANKIGTYGLAVLAAAHDVPFYAVAPSSTFDLTLATGEAIPIEERPACEVTHLGDVAIAPEGVRVANPAFDVTPARYIAAFVTEHGVLRPPFAFTSIRSNRPGVEPMNGVGH